jgi:transmembrane sensor
MPPENRPPRLSFFPGYSGLDLTVLRRVIVGESSPEEQHLVESWASESVQRRRYLGALAALYRRASASEARSAASAWGQVLARMTPPDAVEDPGYVAPWEEPASRVDVCRRQRARILVGGAFQRERSLLWPLLAAAAAVAVVVGGLRATAAFGSHPAPRSVAAMRQIMTATGQRAEIQLDDGSRVVLGVASRLRLPGDFGVRNREVYLEGTAYFDVVHDSTRPFVVRTANAETRDVGTRFVVSSYPESHGTRVVVRDGSVALGAPSRSVFHGRSVLLTRGNLGRLRSGDSVVTTRRVDPALYTAWMQGDLVFQDEPLSDAVAELRRWYNVDIRIGDPSLRAMPISAAFAVESFHEALSVVTTVLPLRAVRRGNVVTIYRRHQ